ncbi:MAG: IS1595 family transposase [Acidimicrobiia bacterium]
MAEYPDDEACLVALWRERYSPDGEHAYCPSPSCKTERTFKRYATTQQRQSWTCTTCGHHLHPTAGTIFHKSSTSLRQWFYCMYLMTSTRCGISAKQVERELGCAYKTALRMMRLIRTELMNDQDDDPEPLAGEVEVDETYVGGRTHAYPPVPFAEQKSRKVPVLAMVERGGSVRAEVLPTAGGAGALEVRPLVMENVKAGSVLYTDESVLYWGMDALYDHRQINHSEKVYVRGDVHTQTIEGFFSTVKTGLMGVFHGVSRRWLQSYINEYVFRYNHREGIDPFKVLVALAARATR